MQQGSLDNRYKTSLRLFGAASGYRGSCYVAKWHNLFFSFPSCLSLEQSCWEPAEWQLGAAEGLHLTPHLTPTQLTMCQMLLSTCIMSITDSSKPQGM